MTFGKSVQDKQSLSKVKQILASFITPSPPRISPDDRQDKMVSDRLLIAFLLFANLSLDSAKMSSALKDSSPLVKHPSRKICHAWKQFLTLEPNDILVNRLGQQAVFLSMLDGVKNGKEIHRAFEKNIFVNYWAVFVFSLMAAFTIILWWEYIFSVDKN